MRLTSLTRWCMSSRSSPVTGHGLLQLRICSSCACDDDARSMTTAPTTNDAAIFMTRHYSEPMCTTCLYMCHGYTLYTP